MIPKLPRQLLWSDKRDISEYMSDELGNEIVSAFSFAKSRITTTLAPQTLLNLYNEAFYLSTRVVYEHDESARPEIYMAEILKDEIDEELAKHVILVMYMVLLLQFDKSKEILHFIDELQKEYLTDTPFFIAKWLHKGIVRIKKSVGYKLVPRPASPSELQKESIDWNLITQGFSKQIIVELLDLWDREEDKGRIIRLIEYACISSHNSTNDDEVNKADETFFAEQKKKYNVVNDYKEEFVGNRGRPESEPLDELFTESCTHAQKERLKNFVAKRIGKEAVFALRVAALPEVGLIRQVPSYSSAKKSFPNIGAPSGYYKYKDEKFVMSEKEIRYYKSKLILPDS